MNKLVRDKTLFTFVEMQEQRGGTWPSTNNAVEAVNARLREMLRLHRGMPTMHRIKAIFWWCYMHSENPLPAAQIIRVMPTDNDVNGLFAAASRNEQSRNEGPEKIRKRDSLGRLSHAHSIPPVNNPNRHTF